MPIRLAMSEPPPPPQGGRKASPQSTPELKTPQLAHRGPRAAAGSASATAASPGVGGGDAGVAAAASAMGGREIVDDFERLIPGGPKYNVNASRRDEGRWLERFEELKSYRALRGDCNVPQKFPENPALARWVNLQRVEYKKLLSGQFTSMTRERMHALKTLGFEWDTLDAAWSRKFDELSEYRRAHGHCNVPLRHGPNPALGRWVIRQRHERRLLVEGKPSQLTREREASLSELGFVWDVGDTSWNERLDELRQYRMRHGHCDVPYVYPPNRKLGHWVRNQRTQYGLLRAGKKSRLSEERRMKLEDIGFAWAGNAAAADDGGPPPSARRAGGMDAAAAASSSVFAAAPGGSKVDSVPSPGGPRKGPAEDASTLASPGSRRVAEETLCIGADMKKPPAKRRARPPPGI